MERQHRDAVGRGRAVTPAGSADAAVGVGSPVFQRLLAAWSVSLVGDGVRAAALPLFTAVSTRSPLAVSAVAVAEVLPWLVIALAAGALVDRWNPRPVLMSAHLVRAVGASGLALAVFAGRATVPLLVAVAFGLTSAETFADSASQLLLVELAGPDELQRANGRLVSAETIGLDLVGPLGAFGLFGWHPWACFLADSLSFLIAGLLVVSLPDVLPRRASHPRGELSGQIVEGALFLLRHKGLRVLVAAVVVAAAASAVNALYALYAVEVLAIPPAWVAMLLVAMGVGTLVSALLMPWLTTRFSETRVMVAALLSLAGGCVVLGGVAHPVAAWLAFGVIGLGTGGWNVLAATRRQRLTPHAMMGRVTSSYRVLAWGLTPLGAGVAGPLANITSLATVFVGAGVLVAVTAVLVARPLSRATEAQPPRAS